MFDLCDDIDDMAVHPALREAEDRLFERADLVFATADALVEKAARHGRGDAHYVPNGVDSARFPETGRREGPVRRAVYVGAIYEWLDEDLLAEVATARPGVEFRIVGPVRRPLNRLRGISNVAIPGPVSAAEVPAELAAADLAMIPFRPGLLTRATDPLKLYEALVAGRPVLATELVQGERFRPAVRTETTAAGWIEAIDDLGTGRWAFDERAMRERVSREESWDERFARMERALGEGG